MTTPFVVHVTLHIRPECREAYCDALARVIERARARPECHYVFVFETADDPDTIQLVESWSDWDTFWNEILALDFYQEYAAVSEAMYARPREVETLIPLHGSERA